MKRCSFCMADLKEEDVIRFCPECGREGCSECLPEDPDKACKGCRGLDDDEEEED